MKVKIGDYMFWGPYVFAHELESEPGVFIILDKDFEPKHWNILDVDCAANVRASIELHKRSACWKSHCSQLIAYAAYYCDDQERKRVYGVIREQYCPPCNGFAITK